MSKRTGLGRLWPATVHSWAGLVAGWREPAFRLEVLLGLVLVPAAFWLGDGWLERAMLLGAYAAVLVVELLNTAVESVVDRVGPEWHTLSKRAKDLGSAAVFVSSLFCAAVYIGALWHK